MAFRGRFGFVRTIRKRFNVTIGELSRATGIRLSRISDIELGNDATADEIAALIRGICQVDSEKNPKVLVELSLPDSPQQLTPVRGKFYPGKGQP